jgi:hypothetical protein
MRPESDSMLRPMHFHCISSTQVLEAESATLYAPRSFTDMPEDETHRLRQNGLAGQFGAGLVS